MNSYLKSYTLQELDEFYKSQGIFIFIRPLIDSPTSLSLKSLIDIISIENTLKILRGDNFSLIINLLGCLSSLDKEGKFTESEKTLLIEKLKILLDAGICSDIEEILKKSSFTKSIEECFEIAKCQQQIDNSN